LPLPLYDRIVFVNAIFTSAATEAGSTAISGKFIVQHLNLPLFVNIKPRKKLGLIHLYRFIIALLPFI